MQYVQFKDTKVSRFIIGSNPFSGFSHQSPQADWDMRHYFTYARIKQTLRDGEALGVNTLIARTDFHVMRMLFEYWDEGGSLQWFAQTCPEVGSHTVCIERASTYHAKACHLHGGVMDNAFAQGKLDEVQPALDLCREKGMLAEGGMRVPFIMNWPGQLPAGKVYEPSVSTLDIASTAVAFAGLPPDDRLDGVNLMPFLTGKNTTAPHEALYWRLWDQAAVRAGKWKYLQAGTAAKYLFDVTSDEHEKKSHPAASGNCARPGHQTI